MNGTSKQPGGYSLAARVLHWGSAAMVLGSVALGLSMTRAATETEAQAADVVRSFSIHKTLGVLILAVTLIRIAVAFTSQRPGPLYPNRRTETFLAGSVHALLYCCLIVLPISGLAINTAAPGYAPILLPFPVHLPFIPISEAVAAQAASVHRAATWLLYAAFTLHLAGVARHAVIDMDTTLARMTSGAGAAAGAASKPTVHILLALAVVVVTVFIGLRIAPPPEDPMSDIDTALDALDANP